jgi:hypothetical protein
LTLTAYLPSLRFVAVADRARLSNSTIFEQVVDQVSLLGRRDLAQRLSAPSRWIRRPCWP